MSLMVMTFIIQRRTIMKTHSIQNGFFSIGFGLLILALSGGAALVINSTHSEGNTNAVQEVQPTYEYKHLEPGGPESDV